MFIIDEESSQVLFHNHAATCINSDLNQSFTADFTLENPLVDRRKKQYALVDQTRLKDTNVSLVQASRHLSKSKDFKSMDEIIND